MKDTLIHNPEQFGARIRLKRKEKGLSQSALAHQLGVERKWVLRLEAGNPKAELGLVLRALRTLGLQIAFQAPGKSTRTRVDDPAPSPLAEVFRRLERRGPK